jgi:outer membrane receptor protein involved in Fe transport
VVGAKLDAGAANQSTARRRSRCAVLLALSLLPRAVVLAADTHAAAQHASAGWVGLPLSAAVARLVASGVPVVYSSHVVRPEMTVQHEPQATLPRAMLDEILAPHGLEAREMASGRIVIVRASAATTSAVAPTLEPAQHVLAPTVLEQVLVTGSRYRFVRTADTGQFKFMTDDLERLPDLGDDPLRAVARLPGAATGGFTGKSNIRGGEVDETLVRFDGFRLYNPFHLKDFQSVFSTIDPALVRAVEVYTGGYPVDLGDRMSGVIDVDPLVTADSPVRVASLGFFSAGFLAGDSFDDGNSDWLASVRRGNLDLILDVVNPDRGKPRYFDVHARLTHRFSNDLAVRASLLRFEDDLDVSEPDREEVAHANYVDTYAWLTVDWSPGASLTSRSYLGKAALDSARRGVADQPGISTGELSDERGSRVLMAASDWRWQWSPTTRLDFGAEYRHSTGRFDYADDVDFDLLFDVPGAPIEPSRTRTLSARPSGEHYSAYLGARLGDSGVLTADLGIRFDHDSLPDDAENTWSPRTGLVWRPSERLALRGSWGRYAQAQSVQELQIADGIVEYQPAQRADHSLLGFSYAFRPEVELELDLYEKRYSDLRPRYENLLNSFVLLPELKPDRIRIAADRARARGAELTVRGRSPDAAFDWWATYSWSRAEDLIGDRAEPRNWDQRNAAGLGLGWHDERWQLDAALTWHTGWPTTRIELAQIEPIAIAEAAARNSSRLGSYFTLDLRAARHFVLERSLLTAYFEVTNATNRRNDCCVEYEFNTEEGAPALELDTSPYLSVIPNLGLVWEF